MAYGDKVAVDGLSLDRRTRHASPPCSGPTAPARPPRWRPARATASRSRAACGCSGSTRRPQRRDLLPRIGVMLQHGGAWSGVRAVEMLRHIAALHAHPLPVPMLVERLGLDVVRADAVPPALGRPAAAARAWRWPSSAAPSWCSSTSRPPGWTRRPAAPPGTCSSELRGDGVTIVLTTHYMDEAERLADQVHVIDRGRLIASGSPFELTRGTGSSTIRLVVTEPFPPDAPASLQASLGPGTEVQAINEQSLLITGPADASTLAKVSAGARSRACSRSR